MDYQIKRASKYGLDCLSVQVPIEVLSGPGRRQSAFILDTGCEVTMVSEDVATALDLPTGGRPTHITGATSDGTGRIVPVKFRFVDVPELEMESEWVVVSNQTKVRLLALRDILPYFEIRTLNMSLYFTRK